MSKKVLLITIIFVVSTTMAFGQTGREIMKKSDALAKPGTVKSKAVLTVYRKGKVDESMKLKLIGKQYGNNEKIFLQIGSPRNMKVLTHTRKGGNDLQWVKLRDGRKKPIRSGSDRRKTFVGSHLFYEDLRSRNISDYRYKIIGSKAINSKECYKIEATPLPGKSIYDKAIFYVIKSGPFANFIIQADIYYKGYFYKQLVNYDIRVKNGIIAPYKAVMYRKQRNGSVSGKTVIQIKYLKYNSGINASRFNPNSL